MSLSTLIANTILGAGFAPYITSLLKQSHFKPRVNETIALAVSVGVGVVAFLSAGGDFRTVHDSGTAGAVVVVIFTAAKVFYKKLAPVSPLLGAKATADTSGPPVDVVPLIAALSAALSAASPAAAPEPAPPPAPPTFDEALKIVQDAHNADINKSQTLTRTTATGDAGVTAVLTTSPPRSDIDPNRTDLAAAVQSQGGAVIIGQSADAAALTGGTQ